MSPGTAGGRPANPCRIAVRELLYHQAPQEQPTAVESVFSRPLSTEEQPYTRKAKVNEAWVPVETGWLLGAGMLHLANEEGRFQQVQPTPGERAAAARKVVEVGLAVAEGEVAVCWLLRPGESLRAEPAEVGRLRLRCREGVARVTVNVFPE